MSLKSMLSYYIYDSKRTLTRFYAIIIGLYIIFGIIDATTGGGGSISGMETSSVIFIFILGLNSFKSQFHFGLVNGVSRKTQFISFMCNAVIIAAFMALANNVLSKMASLFFTEESMYIQLYGNRYKAFLAEATFIQKLQIFGEGFLWSIFLYAMMAMLGFCITLLYYRSNKMLKYVISIIPALVFLVMLPYIDRLTNGWLIRKLLEFMIKIMGFGQVLNPYMAMLTFIVGFGILALFSFLLIRRAVIKQ